MKKSVFVTDCRYAGWVCRAKFIKLFSNPSQFSMELTIFNDSGPNNLGLISRSENIQQI